MANTLNAPSPASARAPMKGQRRCTRVLPRRRSGRRWSSALSYRQVELARVGYRPAQQMNFHVDQAESRDDYLVSMALADGIEAPRIACVRASGSY